MKTNLTIALFATLAVSAYGLTISPTASIIKSGDVTFGYPHPVYGNLDGVIKSKTGQSYGIEAKQSFGRLVLSTEAQFITVPMRSVTVAGKPKNWGDKADGWSVTASAGYELLSVAGWTITPTVGIGYQDLIGGGLIYQAGVEASKSIGNDFIASVTAYNRWSDETEYDGLTMQKDNSIFFGVKLGWKF